MRKRHIKKAGKKLDAETKAIVWPELFKRPKVKITARERAAAKIKNRVDCLAAGPIADKVQ